MKTAFTMELKMESGGTLPQSYISPTWKMPFLKGKSSLQPKEKPESQKLIY